MKIALPEWNGRLSPVFDTCGLITTVDMTGGRPTARRSIPVHPEGPMARADQLADLGVDVLLCGAISRELLDLVDNRGVEVVSFLSGPVDDVLAAYMDGTLNARDFRMPGCGGLRMTCGRGGRRRRGRRGGRGNAKES